MATTKRITMGNAAFGFLDDGKILGNPNPNIDTSISPVLLDLPWDIMDFGVRSDLTGANFIIEEDGLYLATEDDEPLVVDNGNLLETEQGTDIDVFDGATLLHKFFLKSIEAGENDSFRIHAYSGMGLLEDQIFMGAFYQSQTAAAIIADIIGDTLTYTVDPALASIVLTGPIGPMSRRRALSAVLLVLGASIRKDSNGDPLIEYNQQSDAATLGPIGMGGKRLD